LFHQALLYPFNFFSTDFLNRISVLMHQPLGKMRARRERRHCRKGPAPGNKRCEGHAPQAPRRRAARQRTAFPADPLCVKSNHIGAILFKI
jgi:hypothetical protein